MKSRVPTAGRRRAPPSAADYSANPPVTVTVAVTYVARAAHVSDRPHGGQLCYDACVRVAAALTFFLLLPLSVVAQDQLTEARRLYNTHQLEEAERAARAALGQARTANSARVVLARILLEALPPVIERAATGGGPGRTPRGQPNPAGFARARGTDARPRPGTVPGGSLRGGGGSLRADPRLGCGARRRPHDRALDWWATAIDRHAATRPFTDARRSTSASRAA